jgi:hypothetical protein
MPRAKQPNSKTLFATFRVSPQERQQLHRAAENQGISFSDYARMLILGQADSGNKQQA